MNSRYNLMITDMDDVLTPFAKKHGIGLINAAGLHMGILTQDGAPAWHPAPATVHDAARKVVQLCRERGVDISDVAIRFCLDHPLCLQYSGGHWQRGAGQGEFEVA